jgi:hypothetical protein
MKCSILFCLLIGLTACNRYYMPVTGKCPSIDSIKSYINENRHLVLRNPSAAYEMKNVALNELSNEIQCDLQKIKGFQASRGILHIKNAYFETTRPDTGKLNQIHLHTDLRFAKDSIKAIIPIPAIFTVEELTFDRIKTKRHNVGAALGITACAAFATMLVVSVLNEFKDWGN